MTHIVSTVEPARRHLAVYPCRTVIMAIKSRMLSLWWLTFCLIYAKFFENSCSWKITIHELRLWLALCPVHCFSPQWVTLKLGQPAVAVGCDPQSLPGEGDGREEWVSRGRWADFGGQAQLVELRPCLSSWNWNFQKPSETCRCQ